MNLQTLYTYYLAYKIILLLSVDCKLSVNIHNFYKPASPSFFRAKCNMLHMRVGILYNYFIFLPAIIRGFSKNMHHKCCSTVNFIKLTIWWRWKYKHRFIQMINNFKVKLSELFKIRICIKVYKNVSLNL